MSTVSINLADISRLTNKVAGEFKATCWSSQERIDLGVYLLHLAADLLPHYELACLRPKNVMDNPRQFFRPTKN